MRMRTNLEKIGIIEDVHILIEKRIVRIHALGPWGLRS